YEQLAAWRAAVPAPREALLEAAYAHALAWWQPGGGSTAGLDPRAVGGDADAERALLAAPVGARTAPSVEAAAPAAITLRAARRGEGAWGRLLAARVDIAHLPRPVRPVFARLLGRQEAGASDGELASASPDARLVAAAERALAGASPESVHVALG